MEQTRGKKKEPPQESILQRMPMFRYNTPLGHLPKESSTCVYIKRKIPVTKEMKTVPELAYPVESNRKPVPKHELLESDWRAYRSVFHNHTVMARRAGPQRYSKPQQDDIFDILGTRSRPPVLTNTSHQSESESGPILNTYKKNTVGSPNGYFYNAYKQGRLERTPGKPQRETMDVPVLVIKGPFQKTVAVPSGQREKRRWEREMARYAGDVIDTSTDRSMFVYNEPDAIPQSCVWTDFSVPLSERVLRQSSDDRRESRHRRLTVPLSISLPEIMPPDCLPLFRTLMPPNFPPIQQLASGLASDSGNRYVETLHGV